MGFTPLHAAVVASARESCVALCELGAQKQQIGQARDRLRRSFVIMREIGEDEFGVSRKEIDTLESQIGAEFEDVNLRIQHPENEHERVYLCKEIRDI